MIQVDLARRWLSMLGVSIVLFGLLTLFLPFTLQFQGGGPLDKPVRLSCEPPLDYISKVPDVQGCVQGARNRDVAAAGFVMAGLVFAGVARMIFRPGPALNITLSDPSNN